MPRRIHEGARQLSRRDFGVSGSLPQRSSGGAAQSGLLDRKPPRCRRAAPKFLETLDAQQRVDEAARITARYLAQGAPVEPLIATFTRAVVREDAEFHTFQMLEAGVRQHEEWRGAEQSRNILIAVARYLAAHSPTQRAQLQTAQIALRLHRGEMLYEEEAETPAA
ncbi:MAG TPA: hypothetical protein VIT21_02645 [Chthoniobacterales bacterium]